MSREKIKKNQETCNAVVQREIQAQAREPPEELLAFLRREPRRNLTVLVKKPENGQKLAALAPFTVDYPIPASGARYYLCRGGACQSPVDSIAALEKQLDQREK